MMDRQKKVQRKLFYTKPNLDQRVPKDHILRKVAKFCVQAGLIDGSKIFMNSSMVQADASNNSVVGFRLAATI